MPPAYRLSMQDVYDPITNRPRLQSLLEHMQKEGRLEEDVASRIVQEAGVILRKEPNVVEVTAPMASKCSRFTCIDFYSSNFCLSQTSSVVAQNL